MFVWQLGFALRWCDTILTNPFFNPNRHFKPLAWFPEQFVNGILYLLIVYTPCLYSGTRCREFDALKFEKKFKKPVILRITLRPFFSKNNHGHWCIVIEDLWDNYWQMTSEWNSMRTNPSGACKPRKSNCVACLLPAWYVKLMPIEIMFRFRPVFVMKTNGRLNELNFDGSKSHYWLDTPFSPNLLHN